MKRRGTTPGRDRRGTAPGRCVRAAGSLLAVVLAIALAGCGDGYGGPSGPAYDPPGDHTIRRGGALHAPGASDPFAGCAECHGADLRGGDAGEPSCFLCHGQVWAVRVPAVR